MQQIVLLNEALDWPDAHLEPDARSVPQVLIRAGWSRNGRYYSAEVLRAAAPLFEGVRAFADHPTPAELRARTVRSVRHITGWFSDVHFVDGALRGTRHFSRNSAGEDARRLVLDILAGDAPASLIGGSINAVGQAVKGTGPDGVEGMIVEEITAAHSIDDVTLPAAGGGFEPLTAAEEPGLVAAVLEGLSFDDLDAARPDLVQQARTAAQSGEAASDEAAFHEAAALRTENAALHAALEQQVRASALERALRAARLPLHWEAELREQLLAVEAERWPDLIAREQRKARGLGWAAAPVPVQGADRQVARARNAQTAQPGPINMDRVASPADLARLLADFTRRR